MKRILFIVQSVMHEQIRAKKREAEIGFNYQHDEIEKKKVSEQQCFFRHDRTMKEVD